ncbi:unnamed protein product [Mytilus edulis]|uniref:Uncharacterized protein n=1 Tax=Mytilus edulis TaxID=6550 RepID=A0A8S3V0U4_MYTED|nr:unnamed protein product [Mytilus edulis]
MPVQISEEMSLSLNFYKYLCQNIGSAEEVKIRRLTCLIDDLGVQSNSDDQSGKPILDDQITSGSKGEGLQLKGSDYDVMFIHHLFKVYESDRNIVPRYDQHIPLIMDINDTHPCFTQLRLLDNHDLTLNSEKLVNILLGRKASSEQYRLYHVEQFSYPYGVASTDIINIHGPCISGPDDLGKRPLYGQITSGSRGEGLNLNDLDIMYIDSDFKVSESDNDVVLQSDLFIPLVLSIIVQRITSGRCEPMTDSLSFICLGICSQMMGEADCARNGFLIVTQIDDFNLTSASIRLSNLDQI